MKITVSSNEKVHIVFEGKINMKQEVVLEQDDAKKLSNILLEGSGNFDTK